MQPDPHVQRLIDESVRLQKISRALHEKTKFEIEMLQTANLLSQEVLEWVKNNRPAKEQVFGSDSGSGLTTPQSEERIVAQNLWKDLRNGVSEAPMRLFQLPHHIRAVVLEGLVTAMKTRETRENLFSTNSTS